MEQGAAATAARRPRGVGVSGWLGSGSSSLQRLPRQRSHHLDPACLGRCCRCEAPEAAPAVTRERGAGAAALRHNPARGRAASARAARRTSCVAMVPARFGSPRLAAGWRSRRRAAAPQRPSASEWLSLGVGVLQAWDAGLLRTDGVRCLVEPSECPGNSPRSAWEMKGWRTPPCLPASPHPEARPKEWQGK